MKFVYIQQPQFYFVGSYLEDSEEVHNFSIKWTEENYNIQYGKCLTARKLVNIYPRYVYLHLNPNFTYNIWIHDPRFQVLSWNPSGIPGIKKTPFKET